MSYPALSRRAFLTGTAAATVALATGCDSGGKQADNRSGGSTPTSKVTYLTAFGTIPREEHIAVGIAKGFFREAGIDVTVQPGQPSDANLKTLAAGQAQFAAIDYVSAVRGAKTYTGGDGRPNYRVVEAMQQSTLLSLVTLDNTGVRRPADLAGKTVATGPNAASQTLFPTYAKLAGLDPSKVTFQSAPTDQLPSLLIAGKVAAIGTYSVDSPAISAAAATRGAKALALPYSEFLPDLYGSVLIAPASLVSSDADLVKRFSAAMARSLKYAVTNPTEAAQLIKSAVPATNVDAAAEVMKLMAPTVGDGDMATDRVTRSIALLAEAQLAPAGLMPEHLIAFDLLPAPS